MCVWVKGRCWVHVCLDKREKLILMGLIGNWLMDNFSSVWFVNQRRERLIQQVLQTREPSECW